MPAIFHKHSIPIMVDFLLYFETLVKERSGKIILTEISNGHTYHFALFSAHARIQKNDTLSGGIAICITRENVSLRPIFHRQISQSIILRPNTNFTGEFRRNELEDFSKEVSNLIEALKVQQVQETACQFILAKSGDNSLTMLMVCEMVNSIIKKTNTYQRLSHYISEEDKRCLNPLGQYGNRIRKSQIINRFDATNAVTAIARDTKNPKTKWRLMELAGQILWEVLPAEKMLNS